MQEADQVKEAEAQEDQSSDTAGTGHEGNNGEDVLGNEVIGKEGEEKTAAAGLNQIFHAGHREEENEAEAGQQVKGAEALFKKLEELGKV